MADDLFWEDDDDQATGSPGTLRRSQTNVQRRLSEADKAENWRSTGDSRYRTSTSSKIAIEGIAGKWKGEKKEIYTVDELSWTVQRSMDGESRPYNLAWNSESGLIMWSSSYFFDPRDLAEDTTSISWYRASDQRKSRRIFTWRRPPPGPNGDEPLHGKSTRKKKEKLPQTPEEIEAARRREEAAKKKMEEERLKYEEELNAKRKASEEARKRAAEQAKKDAERRAEEARVAREKEQQAILMKVEEQRKKQEDLEKKRKDEEERARLEKKREKQQKLAALSAAATRAASAARKKKDSSADDRKNTENEAALKSSTSMAQVATPRVAVDKVLRRSEACEPDKRPSYTVVLLGSPLSRRRLFANMLFVTGAWGKERLEQFQQENYNEAISASSSGASVGHSRIRCGHFSLDKPSRRFAVLESPGPTEHMPTAMASVAQAHAAVLVVPAQATEFEAALEIGRGPIWQGAAILQAAGVSNVFVAVDGMEHPCVSWRKGIFEELQRKLSPLLQALGFIGVPCVPVSNITRNHLKERHSEGAWFEGKTLLQHLGSMPIPRREEMPSTLFLPLETYTDQGNFQVLGSVLQGRLRPGATCKVMPSGQECVVQAVTSKDCDVTYALEGELVSVKVTGLEMGGTGQGEVFCANEPIRCVCTIRAAMHILKPAVDDLALSSGFTATFCAHGAEEECTLLKLTDGIDLATGEKIECLQSATPDSYVICTLRMQRPVALAVFNRSSALGRFVLRVGDVIVALGKVIDLPKENR